MDAGERLGTLSTEQLQRALDRFDLGGFVSAEPVPFGLFGQNVFVRSTTGDFVLRGAAHYDWQFPQEQFVANVLHQRTDVPVPWPYLVDPDESIFGWPHGYAVMPRMPGLQLADDAVRAAIDPGDRQEIARVLGANLRAVQRATWAHAGRFDLRTATVQPFAGGFAGWLVDELRQLLDLSVSYGTGATGADRVWVEQLIADHTDALYAPCPAVLVLHDYKENNVTVERVAGSWRVAGVFDLMEAVFGDGELDLVRQLAAYLDEDVSMAAAFLGGYQWQQPLRANAGPRLGLFMVYDRMRIWEYHRRPERAAQWPYRATSPQEWVDHYLTGLQELLPR